MTLKQKKYFLFSHAINYLGRMITLERIHIATKTMDAALNLEYPRTTSGLRLFLRLCNFYRKFVSNFARIAVPLNKRPIKSEPMQIELNDEKRNIVDELK